MPIVERFQCYDVSKSHCDRKDEAVWPDTEVLVRTHLQEKPSLSGPTQLETEVECLSKLGNVSF